MERLEQDRQEEVQQATAETGIQELKAYVKAHPANRLAWFFLGKAYARQGMDAKANYCYLKSGSIYEAFENEVHPLTLDGGPLHSMLEEWDRTRRRKKRMIRILLIALSAWLLAAPAAAPGWKKTGSEAVAGVPSAPPGHETQSPADSASAAQPMAVLWMDGGGVAGAAAAAMGRLASSKTLTSAVAAELPRTGKYYRWQGEKKGVLEAVASSPSGEYDLRTADQERCSCESGLSAAADERIAEEVGMQEQAWSVISAIRQYKRLNGKWPVQAEQLTRNYPANLLPGLPPGAETQYDEWLSIAKQGSGSGAAGQPEGKNPAAGSAAAAGLNGDGVLDLTGSLEIFVDTKSRRLFLMSGSILVREYPVGVGGDRTPHGRFDISEKVRNPNGTSKGPFGSRGMTLSDTRYAIHGTDEPDSIGSDRSLGCIRMAKKDLEELFDLVPLGTGVTIGPGIPSGLKDGKLPQEYKRYSVDPAVQEENPGVVYDWL